MRLLRVRVPTSTDAERVVDLTQENAHTFWAAFCLHEARTCDLACTTFGGHIVGTWWFGNLILAGFPCHNGGRLLYLLIPRP